jgi:prepilin-type N-terminal cleavage/methylation domain-containing protein/prepilin-type processing-associated H-X9-DG protein
MPRRAFTLIELLVVIAVIAIIAAILFPVFSRAREQARASACLSNVKQIGMSVHLYAQDNDEQFPMGTYPEAKNWEVNPDADPYPPVGDCRDETGGWKGFNPGDGGPDYTGCSYGGEFYRTLMRVQLAPHIRNVQAWYCPSDKRRKPDAQSLAHGLQSFHWFPNWLFNNNGSYPLVVYPRGRTVNLRDEPMAETSNYAAERILFAERGVFGQDGPDGSAGKAPNGNYNHPQGYNVVYFDGHAKLVPYGRKWTTVPASGWPPADEPR